MRIQNNITAMNTHRQYTINNDNVAKSAEKLSSGYRINRAADDAAGLAISEKMRSQIRGLNMATKNSQDAISLVQTAEGALQETHSMLQRMNELAVQAATGTNQDFDKIQAAKEFEQLKREINDVAESTTFNNMKILDGSFSYKGYERSAYTAGVTVTRPTPAEGSSAASTPVGGTISTAADATLAGDTPTDNITVTVKYKDADGKDATATLTTTGIDNTNTKDVATLAGGTDAEKAMLNLASADGKWTGKINADGSISLTATDAAFKEGEAAKIDIAGTGVTGATDAAGTVTTAAAAAEAAAEAAANGTAGQGVLDVSSFGTVAATGGAVTVEFTITDANGNTGKISNVSVASGDSLGTAGTGDAALASLTGEVEMKDNTGATVYKITLTPDATTATDIKVTEAADADGKVTGADLTGLSIDFAKDGGAGNIGTSPGAVTIDDGNGDAAAATLKGVAPVAPEADTSTKTPDVTTIEFGFDKMRDGDEVTINIGDQDLKVQKEAGDTRATFIDKLETAVTKLKTDLGITDDSVRVSGTAIVVEEGIEVKEPTLSADGTDGEKTTAMRIQVGALENEQLNIAIDSMNTAGLGLDSMNLETQDAAGAAITAVRAAVNKVSDQRATLGAMQNRLDHKIANLKVSSENLSAAESRIRDVDMASEMTNFTKNNILSQAATAMLAQANALPQNVLSLLG